MGKKKAKKEQARKPARTREDPSPEAFEFDLHAKGTLRLEDCDPNHEYPGSKKDYEDELERLQEKLFALQIRRFLDQKKAVLVFEGWDAAGKGGIIRRLTTLMDPRTYKVWPIAAPKDAEARQHYLWRFVMRLPDAGELAIFDRSWYGRVLVERVEGFCAKDAWTRAYDEINAFERTLTADGLTLVKFWLHIDKKTQLRRFKDRENDPVRNYKIGPDDWRNRKKWNAYEAAVQDMLDRTHRPDAPWVLVSANDKRHARLFVLNTVASLLGETS